MNPYTGLSDEKLMCEYTQGNHMAFEVLFGRHEARVYSYLTRRVSDINAVDEIFQNVFLKVHKHRENYDSKFVFLKWLYTICRSEVIDFFKYKKGVFEQFDETKFSQEVLPEDNLFELDLKNLNYLSEKEKEALQLKYYSDKDYQEISTSLGITPANSRKIVSRGLGKIRKKLFGGGND